MPRLVTATGINAEIERCFDLARDVDVHCETAAFTDEKATGGTTTGLLTLGDTVTFEGVHFCVRQRHTSKITECVQPFRFVDEMVSGAFRSFRHVHEFARQGNSTIMTDTIVWTSPFGLLGRMADPFIWLHLRSFLQRRNRELKRIAEASATAA